MIGGDSVANGTGRDILMLHEHVLPDPVFIKAAVAALTKMSIGMAEVAEGISAGRGVCRCPAPPSSSLPWRWLCMMTNTSIWRIQSYRGNFGIPLVNQTV